MSIVVPHVKGGLHPETMAALENMNPRYEVIDPEDDDGYWRVLSKLWTAAETVIVVEQDMAPTREQLVELWDCPEPYCVAMCTSRTGAKVPGGTAKFSAKLMQDVPDALIDIRGINMGRDALVATHWWHVRGFIDKQLAAGGFEQHLHDTEVRHIVSGVTNPREPGSPANPYGPWVFEGKRRPLSPPAVPPTPTQPSTSPF